MLLLKATRLVQDTEVGVALNGEILSTLVYADDIVIIARSPEGSKQAFEVLENACKEIGMSVSISKSQAVKSKHVGIMAIKDFPLQTVLSYKYLGVKLDLESVYYMLEYSADRLAKSKTYCYSTIALAKESPSPALFASRIWLTVAIPAILYGSEAVLIRKKELDDIEKEQAKIAKFILQLPESTPNVVAQVLAGFEPIEVVYWRRVLRFYGELHVSDTRTWQYKAFREMMNMESSINYRRQVEYMLDRLDLEGPRELEIKLRQYSSEITNAELTRCNATLFALPRVTPEEPVRTSPFFNRQELSDVYHQFLCMNAKLGNRKKLPTYIERFLICPLCGDDTLCFNELHLLYECQELNHTRYLTGIQEFMENQEELELTKLHQRFMTGKDLKPRLRAMKTMREEYFSQLGEPMEI